MLEIPVHLKCSAAQLLTLFSCPVYRSKSHFLLQSYVCSVYQIFTVLMMWLFVRGLCFSCESASRDPCLLTKVCSSELCSTVPVWLTPEPFSTLWSCLVGLLIPFSFLHSHLQPSSVYVGVRDSCLKVACLPQSYSKSEVVSLSEL